MGSGLGLGKPLVTHLHESERLARLRESGVTRVVFGLPPADRDVVVPLLDRYAEIMKALG